jgi:hypothetical protein
VEIATHFNRQVQAVVEKQMAEEEVEQVLALETCLQV